MPKKDYECNIRVRLLAGGDDADMSVCEGCGVSKAVAVAEGEAFPRLFDIQVQNKHLTLCHRCASVVWKLTAQAISGDIRYAVVREGYDGYVVKMCYVVRESSDGVVLDEIVDSSHSASTQYSFSRENAKKFVFETKDAAEKMVAFLCQYGG